MNLDPQETIAALASAPGGAARGILRIGGPNTVGVVGSLFRSSEGGLDTRVPRIRQGVVSLRAPDRSIPAVLFLWPGTRSYLGQPLAELHTLGSPPVLDALLGEVLQAGARLAQPGEFTLRAFLSGRLDLTQVEAVLGVIEADGRDQLNTALAQLAGGLSARIQGLRDDLLDLVADLEAGLDFAEEDLSFLAREELLARLCGARRRVQELQSQMTARTSAPAHHRAMLVGRSNVGKSSLFNALVARFGVASRRVPPALVSEQAGTTRDYLQATLAQGGLQVELVDTAGTRGTADEIETNAHRLRAREQESVNLVLVCLEAGRAADQEELDLLDRYRSAPHLQVSTKADQATRPASTASSVEQAVSTSSVTGDGVDELMRRIVEQLRSQSGAVVAGTAVRCRESLSAAAQAIDRALEEARLGGREELVALEVRLTLEELGRVVGAVYTDDILDRIFSRFCIGK